MKCAANKGGSNNPGISPVGIVTLHCTDETSRSRSRNNIRSCTSNVRQVHGLKLAAAVVAEAFAVAARTLIMLYGE